MQIMMRPTIALAMGEPAGISPELTARLLALDDIAARARLVVIGDRRVLDDGARVATVRLDLKNVFPMRISRNNRTARFSSISAISIRHRSRQAPPRPKAASLRWQIIVTP
jgi:4-hydroxythreonine-4-phosphate dehydrogenase